MPWHVAVSACVPRTAGAGTSARAPARARRVSSSQLAWKESWKRGSVRVWRSRLCQPTLAGYRSTMDVGSGVSTEGGEARIGVALPWCSCTRGTYRPAILFRVVDCICIACTACSDRFQFFVQFVLSVKSLSPAAAGVSCVAILCCWHSLWKSVHAHE